MFKNNPEDSDLLKLIKDNEQELKADWIKTFDELEATLNVLRDSLKYCEDNGLTDLKLLWNFAVFLNILLYDFKLAIYHITHEEREWSKRFFIRGLLTLIYEAMEDIPQLTGGAFRSVLKKFNTHELLVNELNQVSSTLNQYKQANADYFKEVRNISFAHRDHDAKIQANQILSLDWGKAIRSATTFDPILRAYGGFIQRVQSQVAEYKMDA